MATPVRRLTQGAIKIGLRVSNGPYPTALLLAAALMALSFPLVFLDRALTGIDLQLIFWPYRSYLGSSFSELRIPLWNPFSAMGTPFAANLLARVFYPLDWLFLPLSPERALTASSLLHVMLGGIGMWGFSSRGLRVRPSAAMVGALAFGLSGLLMARVAQPNFLVAVAWMPAAFLAAHATARPGGSRWIPALGIVLALQFLGGHPQYTWMTVGALLPWMIFESIRMRWPGSSSHTTKGIGAAYATAKTLAWGSIAWVTSMVLLAGLAAVQILPALKLWWLAARRSDLGGEILFEHSVVDDNILMGMFPLFQTIPVSAEIVGYVGFIAGGLAITALIVAWRQSQVWFLTLLAALAIVFSFGDNIGVYEWYYDRLPGFLSFRAPARWLAVATFSLAGLASVGAHGLAEATVLRRRIACTVGIMAVFAVVGYLVARELPKQVGSTTETNAIWTGVGLTAVTLIGLAAARGRRVALILPLAVAIELSFAALPYDLSTGIPVDAYRDPNHLAYALAADGFDGRILAVADVETQARTLDPDRLAQAKSEHHEVLGARVFRRYTDALANREAGRPNLGVAEGIASSDLYDGGMGITRQFLELQSTVIPRADTRIDYTLLRKLGVVPNPKVLNLLNVRYVIEDTQFDGVVEDFYVDMDLDLTLRPSDPPVRINLSRPYSTTAILGFSFLGNAAHLENGEVAGRIRLIGMGGQTTDFTLRAGHQTAEGNYDNVQGGPTPRHDLPGYTRRWRGDIRGYDSGFAFTFDKPLSVIAVEAIAIGNSPTEFHLRGLTLQGSDGGSLPVPVRAGGQLQLLMDDPVRLAPGQGLKIYRNDPVLPRAYAVRQVHLATDTPGALAALATPSFNPHSKVVLQRDGPPPVGLRGTIRGLVQWLGILPPRHGYGAIGDASFEKLQRIASATDGHQITLGDGQPGGNVVIISDRPEQVRLRAQLDSAAIVVLADSIYPDWKVTIGGHPATILRANHNFRGLVVPAGNHILEFNYDPAEFRLGWILSSASAVLVAGLALMGVRSRRCKMGACNSTSTLTDSAQDQRLSRHPDGNTDPCGSTTHTH